jgi:hypothetical protein
MVARYVPLGGDRRKLIYESHLHIWDDPYLFRVCSDGLLRRCVPAKEGIKIIECCHSSPYGGHYGAFRTHAKIWQSGFFWPTMYKDTRTLSEDADHVRSMATLLQEMPCHSLTTFRSSCLIVGVLITWDHSRNQRTVNTS